MTQIEREACCLMACEVDLALQKDSDVILFGGEFLDVENDKMYVKSELYRFHTSNSSWTKITIPNGSGSTSTKHTPKLCS